MAYVYHPPILTVDCVIFQLVAGKLNVLLIQRAVEPFLGAWSLPGGYNAAGNTTLQALDRALQMKVGLVASELPLVEQLYTFDTVARDPRGHAVSVTYMGLSRKLEPEVSDATQLPTFFPVDELPPLAFDHAEIVQYARERLESRIASTNAVYALLPEMFTLTQLQAAYEAIHGRVFDKRNFRKKFLSLDLVAPTDQYYQDGAHRPAMLYTFIQQKLQPLLRDF